MIDETNVPDQPTDPTEDEGAEEVVDSPGASDVDRPVAPTGPTSEQQRPGGAERERLADQPSESIGKSDDAEQASREGEVDDDEDGADDGDL